MKCLNRKLTDLKSLLLFSLLMFIIIPEANAWSNGGSWSQSPSSPTIGTHDWIAEKAVGLLPANEATIFRDNMNWLKYGTELPDRPRDLGGYGDTFNHHVYFDGNHRVIDDSAAARANETYHEALSLLKKGNFSGGVMLAGALSHYISDMAVFGHIMGADSPWGVEHHHADYEGYVNEHQYLFENSIALIAPLGCTSVYQETLDLAFNTMFTEPNATWMDANYGWNNFEFKARVGNSLNRAVNSVANVLHTLWLDAGRPIPEFQPILTPIIVMVAVITLFLTRYIMRRE